MVKKKTYNNNKKEQEEKKGLWGGGGVRGIFRDEKGNLAVFLGKLGEK